MRDRVHAEWRRCQHAQDLAVIRGGGAFGAGAGRFGQRGTLGQGGWQPGREPADDANSGKGEQGAPVERAGGDGGSQAIGGHA